MEYDENISGLTDNKIFTKTFFWMFLGLIATAIVATYTYFSGLCFQFVTDGTYTLIMIAEIAVVLIFSLLFRKLSAGVVTVLFFVYSMVNGLTLSTIFAIFDLSTISYALFATAGLYGALAFVGYSTKRDISKIGNILFIGLIAGLILSVINIFIGSSMLDIVLDWVILAIFLGFTAYDVNKIKAINDSGAYDPEKVSIYGAMELYLDFINIFLRLLSIIGRNRD